MSKSPPRLGKGLSALVNPRAAAPVQRSSPPGATEHDPASRSDGPPIRLLRLEQIRPNPHQPRTTIDKITLEQLAASIRSSGLLQPILVRSIADDQFELIAGERRWRAAQLADLETIPAIVRDVTEAQSFELALIENLQREDLGPLERANGYQQLIDTSGVTIDDLAARLGESRANISNYIRLLKLGEEIRRMICAGELGMGQARAIAGISNPQRQLAIARLAARRNLSVRQVEALAKEQHDTDATAPRQRAVSDAHLAEVEQSFSKALGLGVRLLPGKKKNSGRVVIRYNSLEEFDRIAEKIGGQTHLE